jgi:hypothetical protein
VIEDFVAERAPDRGQWLERTGQAAGDVGAFVSTFANASRHTARAALGLTPDDVRRLREVGITWPLTRWALDDMARTALLLRAGETLTSADFQGVVDAVYRKGDTRERQAILRALPLLASPDRFLAIAVEAARSGVPPLFEAIACDNPYPAAHFPTLNFNSLVMHALAMGVPLACIVGLGARVTPDLVRAANDYGASRRAARRSVPADLDYITAATRVVAA